jgi:signal peptidase
MLPPPGHDAGDGGCQLSARSRPGGLTAQNPGAPTPRHRRIRGILSMALTISIVGGWWIVLRPAVVGGPAGYVMVSGESMEPMLHTGDLVVTRKQDSYEPGDVVAYRVPRGEQGEGASVIHRIIGGSAAGGYVLQGDNRETTDLWHPKESDIIGSQWIFIPGLARKLTFLHTPLGAAVFAAVIVFVVIVFPGRSEPEVPEATQDVPATGSV